MKTPSLPLFPEAGQGQNTGAGASAWHLPAGIATMDWLQKLRAAAEAAKEAEPEAEATGASVQQTPEPQQAPQPEPPAPRQEPEPPSPPTPTLALLEPQEYGYAQRELLNDDGSPSGWWARLKNGIIYDASTSRHVIVPWEWQKATVHNLPSVTVAREWSTDYQYVAYVHEVGDDRSGAVVTASTDRSLANEVRGMVRLPNGSWFSATAFGRDYQKHTSDNDLSPERLGKRLDAVLSTAHEMREYVERLREQPTSDHGDVLVELQGTNRVPQKWLPAYFNGEYTREDMVRRAPPTMQGVFFDVASALFKADVSENTRLQYMEAAMKVFTATFKLQDMFL